MKSIFFSLSILFSVDLYARDYFCTYHVVDRYDANFIKKIEEISTRGPSTACSLAIKSCETYIDIKRMNLFTFRIFVLMELKLIT
jgi:hypothetical protein